jgi:hypothetical protein
MPVFLVTDPQTGRKVKLTGDSPPTEQELNEIFANLPQQSVVPAQEPTQPEQEPTLGQQAVGALENVGALVSGALAEPIAGLAGIGALLPGGQTPTEAIESTRESLTFQPRTEVGQAQQQAIGEALQPVGEAIQGASEFLGDNVLELTGSPELATLAATAPTAAIEALGLKGLRSSTLKGAARLPTNAKKAVIQAAPSIQELKTASGNLYKQLDQSGVKIKPEVYDRFVSSIEVKLKKEGIRRKQHPKAFDALQAIKEEAGKSISFSDLNSLRRTAGDAAGNVLDKADARLGRIILDRVDDGIDRLADVAGKDARGARQLWRRARVSESIAGMIENAGLAASGLENGLRIEARKILRSAKKSRGFTNQELNVLKELDQGSGAANAAKFLGKFGISEGKATSMLGATIGGTIGQATGGAAGAITIPVLGQIAKKAAQKLTSGKAKFADQLVRAGGDARAIAKAYLKNTPKAKQNVSALTELLLDPKVTPESITKLPIKIKIIEDAKFFANEIKRRATTAASASAIAAPSLLDEDENG